MPETISLLLLFLRQWDFRGFFCDFFGLLPELVEIYDLGGAEQKKRREFGGKSEVVVRTV